MASAKPTNRRVRFATYEADFRSGELRMGGLKIKLQPQPFRILALLLENPGEVVTRERLQLELWPDNTHVEFDLGLNAAVKKLRAALHDDAQHPRYVETLPRIGYRFIFPVEEIEKLPDAAAAKGQHAPGSATLVNEGSAEPVANLPDSTARPLQRRFATLAWVAVSMVAVASGMLSTSAGRRYLFGGDRFDERLATLRITWGSEVSPDGNWLAYRDAETGHLWLRDLHTGENRELVRDWTGTSIAWSPDSRRIAVAINAGSPQRIDRMEVVDIATGNRTPVASEWSAGALPFDWAADGRLLCYMFLPDDNRNRQLIFLSPDDGMITPIRTVPAGSWAFELSPDGRFIVFWRIVRPGEGKRNVVPQSDILLIPVHGDGPEVIISDHPDDERSPFWSQDSTKVYFVRGKYVRSQETSLWMAPIHPESGEPAGNAVRVAQLGNRSLYLDPTASADGDLFISRTTAQSQLYLLEVDPVTGRAKGEPASDFPENSGSPHWRPGGEWLAYRSNVNGLPRGINFQHLVERNMNTGEERLVKAFKTSIIPQPRHYSEPAEADWVVYAERNSNTAYRKNLATGQTETLLETDEPISRLLAFDDGGDILFSTHSAGRDRHTIRVMHLSDRSVRRLGVTRGPPQLKVSPDGREIAVVDYNCLVVLQRTGGEPEELVCTSPPRLPAAGTFRGELINFTWWTDLEPSWSPDGAKIAWTVTVEEKNRVELQIVDRFTGTTELAWAGEVDFYKLPRQPAWSPDGSKIAFSMQQYLGHEIWALRGLVR